MFQFLRRVSGSLLPRPDRPWRDDATSHAPTIGRKRRYSITEDDADDSRSKRSKNDPVKPDKESDPASEGVGLKGAATPSVEGQEVKEVVRGVNTVDLEDKDKAENASSIHPEGIPLPGSPSGSPEPESESTNPSKAREDDEARDQEQSYDQDSVSSSTPEDEEEEVEDGGGIEAGAITTGADAKADGGAVPTQEVIATVDSGLLDNSETLEVKA